MITVRTALPCTHGSCAYPLQATADGNLLNLVLHNYNTSLYPGFGSQRREQGWDQPCFPVGTGLGSGKGPKLLTHTLWYANGPGQPPAATSSWIPGEARPAPLGTLPARRCPTPTQTHTSMHLAMSQGPCITCTCLTCAQGHINYVHTYVSQQHPAAATIAPMRAKPPSRCTHIHGSNTL